MDQHRGTVLRHRGLPRSCLALGLLGVHYQDMTSTVARVYTRLSRDKADQTSTARQEADAVSLAQRLGFSEVVIYAEEPGTSGYSGVALPERDRLLAETRRGDLVVAWALDRFTRQGMEDAGRLLRLIEEAGARLVTVTDGIDTGQDLGDLSVGVRAILAREESRKIATRVASAKALARKEGRWLGGRPPYGLVVIGGRLHRDPETAPVARRIADEILAGRSLWSVVQGLNADAIPSPRGGSWSVGTVAQLVRSPAFAGVQGQRAKTASGKWAATGDVWLLNGEPVSVGEGIVTVAERSRILAALEARTAETDKRTASGTVARRGRREVRSLLGDVLRCGSCGGRVAVSGDDRHRSYRCGAMARGKGCRGFTAPVDGTDEAVSTALLHRLVTLEPGDGLLDEVGDRWTARVAPESVAEREEARKAHDAAVADLERIRGLIADGTFDAADAAAVMPRLRERVASALARLEQAPRMVADVTPLLDVAQSRPAWDGLPVEERRALIGLAVETVEVAPARGRGFRFSPRERLTVTWADGTTTRGADAWPDVAFTG